MNMRRAATAALGSAIAAGFATAAFAADVKLPRSMIWSAYDLGSSGYAEASGMANGLQKKYSTRIRIVPAGTSIGRLLPMTTGKVKYGFLANEVFFAAEALYDFADQSWGPQDLRIVLGRPASNGLACANDVGITSIASLKGKRIGMVKANPSVNVKVEAVLAFGGLTTKDVQVVLFGSYNAQKDAILANQLDCFITVTTSANVRQIEASPRGIYWPEFPPSDKAGWERLLKKMSFVAPFKETVGAGISKEKPRQLYSYRYPMVTTYASTSTEEVYNLVKAIDSAFDLFKNTTGSSKNWDVKRSILPPADAPWHDGAIKYAKEKGYWTKEAQEWHEKRLARLKKVQEAWDKAIEEFNAMRVAERKKGNKINAKTAWPKYWAEYRVKHLD
ncbi:MAG: TAXI family TRAP transporter solute-binding subunit [Hyphomicrobiaceae bacterium]|nr:TAXI family TRAP transporter solute-binding subunit [Hyphomicrobiaceae bacterium]